MFTRKGRHGKQALARLPTGPPSCGDIASVWLNRLTTPQLFRACRVCREWQRLVRASTIDSIVIHAEDCNAALVTDGIISHCLSEFCAVTRLEVHGLPHITHAALMPALQRQLKLETLSLSACAAICWAELASQLLSDDFRSAMPKLRVLRIAQLHSSRSDPTLAATVRSLESKGYQLDMFVCTVCSCAVPVAVKAECTDCRLGLCITTY